jgi:hypothetical protein
MGRAGSAARPQLPSLGQSSVRTLSRFEHRQAALRANSSFSSSQSTSFSSQSSGGINAGISPQRHHNTSHSAVAPPPPPRQPAAADEPGSQLSGGSNSQPPAPLQRTGASVIRAASASTVRSAPYVLFCVLNTFILRRRLCRPCCAGVRSSCRSSLQRHPTRARQALQSATWSSLSRSACSPAECSPTAIRMRPRRAMRALSFGKFRGQVYLRRGMSLAATIAEKSCPAEQATPAHCS